MNHQERKHAKYSPSGFERIQACPGSVKLSIGLPDKSSAAAMEGTRCHEVLERMLKTKGYSDLTSSREMVGYARMAAEFIKRIRFDQCSPQSHFLVETKVSLSFIHEDFWGSLDAAIVEHFGVLHIFDFKYGKHLVSPERNFQLIAYALGVAHEYDYNFKKARLTIIQPRARGVDAPAFWDITISSLQKYADIFRKAIERAEERPDIYVEGEHCWFCKAKTICPLKRETKLSNVRDAFAEPI